MGCRSSRIASSVWRWQRRATKRVWPNGVYRKQNPIILFLNFTVLFKNFMLILNAVSLPLFILGSNKLLHVWILKEVFHGNSKRISRLLHSPRRRRSLWTKYIYQLLVRHMLKLFGYRLNKNKSVIWNWTNLCLICVTPSASDCHFGQAL